MENCNTLAEWRRYVVERPSQAVVGRGDFTTAWEGRPTPIVRPNALSEVFANQPLNAAADSLTMIIASPFRDR